MSHVSPLRRARSAFTLIELLTVIAIIGILAAIIIPTVGKVRQSARNTQCVAQLREWGRVVSMYALDNKGNYYTRDWASAAASESSYRRYFTHSNEEIKRFRLCPSDPNTPTNLALNTSASLTPTYSLVRGSINGAIANVAPDTAIPLGRARTPSQYLLMMDSIQNSNTGITGADLTTLTTYIEPLANNTAAHVDRHGGRTFNAVFGDGSMRRITYTASSPADKTAIQTMRTTWFQLY